MKPNITDLERRISEIQTQMETMLSMPGLTAAQKQAVKDGHQMMIGELREKIQAA
jgi:hypothetical protein